MLTAIVTGAGGGIGSATARGLATAGYRTILFDIDARAIEPVTESLQAEFGDQRVEGVTCDVSDEDSVRAAFEEVRSRYGAVDVLHSNAAIFRGNGVGNDGPLESLDLATWQQTIDVNLTGSFLCCKYALPLMLDRDASVVLTASVGGALLGGTATAYASTKAGLIGLARAMVMHYAPRGLRINVICPGPVMTNMSKQLRETPRLRQRMIDSIPAGRIAEPDDIANVVVFLASPQSSYLNGAVIPVDGGLVLA